MTHNEIVLVKGLSGYSIDMSNGYSDYSDAMLWLKRVNLSFDTMRGCDFWLYPQGGSTNTNMLSTQSVTARDKKRKEKKKKVK